MNWLLTSLVITAATTSFTVPTAVTVDENLKFSAGTLASLEASNSSAVVTTAAGPVKFLLKDARIFGGDQKPVAFKDLAVGQKVNVYFNVADGAQVRELDIKP